MEWSKAMRLKKNSDMTVKVIHDLRKTMEAQILDWEMPRTEEPDGPQSMGSIKVGHN